MESMKNNDLISIEALIQKLNKAKIDLGKGDPYNRLRYYTKIGWLPNMVRRTSKSGDVIGHYPESVVETLSLINQYKNEGYSNDEISEKLGTHKKYNTLQNLLGTENLKTTVFLVGLTIIVILAIIFPTSFTREYEDLANFRPEESSAPNIILQSGAFYMPRGRSEIFISTPDTAISTAKVYVTFEADYKPATRYWVEKHPTDSGFYLKLDAPVLSDTAFNWWITN